MAERTRHPGDQGEVDSVYHVILNDELKDEFIEWLEKKNQEAVPMDKDVDTNNTWKKNDAFFGIGEYPIVEKARREQEARERLSSLRRTNLRTMEREAAKDKAEIKMLTRYNNDLLEKISKKTPSRPRAASPQMGDVGASEGSSEGSSGDDLNGGRRRKRKTRRLGERKARKKTRKKLGKR